MVGMRDALTKWENGAPRISTILKICTVFNCTSDWLLTGQTTGSITEGGDSIEDNIPLNKLEKRLIYLTKNLDTVMKQIAIISTEQISIGRKMDEQKEQIDDLDQSLGELKDFYVENQKKSA